MGIAGGRSEGHSLISHSQHRNAGGGCQQERNPIRPPHAGPANARVYNTTACRIMTMGGAP